MVTYTRRFKIVWNSKLPRQSPFIHCRAYLQHFQNRRVKKRKKSALLEGPGIVPQHFHTRNYREFVNEVCKCQPGAEEIMVSGIWISKSTGTRLYPLLKRERRTLCTVP